MLTVVTLKTVRHLEGRNSDGTARNETINVKLIRGSIEYTNFLKNVRFIGISELSVEKVTQGEKEFKEIPISDEIRNEVALAWKQNETPLTPEQKKIAELEEKLNRLMSASPKDEPKKVEVDPELEAAREEYMKVFGEKGKGTWSVETIRKKIAEKLEQDGAK